MTRRNDFIQNGGPNAMPSRVSSILTPWYATHYATWMVWIGSSSCSSSSQHKSPTKQTESRAPNNQKAAEIEQDSEAAAMESRSLETCSRSSISLFHKTMAGMQLPSVRLPHAAVKFDKGSTQSVTLARSSPVRNQQEDTCSSSTKLTVQESNVVMRRTMLSLMSSSLFAAAAATSSCAGAKPMMPMMEEPDLPRFRKTPSGVKIQEVVDGSGPMAKTGDTLEFNFVCRRSNGYFVYSTVDQFNDQSQPAVLPLGVGKIIPGLEEVLAGMRLGGKRRALIPPEVGYTDALLEPQPKEFGPRRALMSHAKEPLVFEVQLLKIR